jgi:hypothetical protein
MMTKFNFCRCSVEEVGVGFNCSRLNIDRRDTRRRCKRTAVIFGMFAYRLIKQKRYLLSTDVDRSLYGEDGTNCYSTDP